MLAFAVDHPTPATVFLITGDRDYAYAVSILKLRKYQVILVVPSSPNTSPSLESQASLVIDWGTAVLRSRTDPANSIPPVRQPYPDLDPTLVTKLLRELREFPLDDPDTLQSYPTPPQATSKVRRVTTRDLLEPSRHSKNTESLDSTQDFTRNPASPRKYTSTGSDSAPGGFPIPKTPSRSRHASVSTGSTRARSTTLVAQSPPAVEHYTPAKNPPPSTGGRPSTSDLTNVANPEKRRLSVLTSLDALELPLREDCPPSSIIVRSPLEPAQSTCDIHGVSGNSSHKLNGLASPFVLTKAPTESHTTVKPTSPSIVPTKMLTETVTSVCETSQTKDIGVPKEIEHLAGLHVENNQSIPHRAHSEGARDAPPDLANSNYHSYVTSHTMHSLSDRNVGLHLTDTPSSKHLSLPAAGFLGVGDGDDSAQFAPLSYTRDRSAPGTVSPSSSRAPSSSPSTTTESHEHDESERCQTWTMFRLLIHLLLAAREAGINRPPRSIIAVALVKSDKQVYQRAGVSRFKDYTALAEQAGVIELGGIAGDAWIALHPSWFGVDGITTTQFLSNGISSPTSQDSLLTGSEMIERAEIFQTPDPRSLESSDTFPTSSTNRRDSASWNIIPVQFQPLINTLVRIRAEGSHQPRRSLVGQMLGPVIYSRAGVPGFKEYIHTASEAQLIEVGGIGGDAWIRLHPELQL